MDITEDHRPMGKGAYRDAYPDEWATTAKLSYHLARRHENGMIECKAVIEASVGKERTALKIIPANMRRWLMGERTPIEEPDVNRLLRMEIRQNNERLASLESKLSALIAAHCNDEVAA